MRSSLKGFGLKVYNRLVLTPVKHRALPNYGGAFSFFYSKDAGFWLLDCGMYM